MDLINSTPLLGWYRHYSPEHIPSAWNKIIPSQQYAINGQNHTFSVYGFMEQNNRVIIPVKPWDAQLTGNNSGTPAIIIDLTF